MTKNDVITLAEVPEVLGCLPEFSPSKKSIDFITPDYLGSFLFHKGAAAADALQRISLRHALVDLEIISDAELTALEREVASGSIPARTTLDRVKSLAVEKITRYVSDTIQTEMIERLSGKLKARGFADDSPVHPALIDAIDICSRNGYSSLELLEGALKNEILHCSDLIAAIANDSQSAFHNTAIRSLEQAPLEFIKDHTEGFYAPEKEAAALERWQESLKDEKALTPLEPDTCYVDPANNRAVLIKVQPFDGELEGMSRFRKRLPDTDFTPVYTWHLEYDSPHKSEFYNSTDFLLDLLGTETLPFSWQPAGEDFAPVVEAAADRGFYIVPIEVRENSRSPYRLGYTWGNGYIADGFAVAPKVGDVSLFDVVSEVQAALDLANACYQGKGFEAQIYNLETGELLCTDHAVGFVESFSSDTYLHTKAPFVLKNCPDFSSAKQQLKDKGLSPRTHTNSLSDLAQEAKTASQALSNKERNIEVKEHEER